MINPESFQLPPQMSANAAEHDGLEPQKFLRGKLATPDGHAVYSRRKVIVEPVFGQIKEVRRFRRFSFRGLPRVAAEWLLICLTHNLLKLHRAGWGTPLGR